MAGFCLAIFECAGIQSYVFAGNRLSENIGASELVERATRGLLEESIDAACARNGASQPVSLAHWRTEDRPRWRMAQPGLTAEVVYQGGGNAAVLFRERSAAERCLGIWSRRLLHDAPGLTPAAVIAEGDVFSDALEQAHRKLAALKRSRVPAARLEGIGITRACQSTGLAATVPYPEKGGGPGVEWVSAAAAKKRDASKDVKGAKGANERLRETFGDWTGSFHFPLEFEDLGGEEGESHIAVIHADGNGLGQRFRQAASRVHEGDPLYHLRMLSRSVTEAGTRSLGHVIDLLRQGAESGYLEDQGLRLDMKEGRRQLPLRPLVYGGDDLTLVCDGRLGLAVAAEYLRTFAEQTASDEEPLGACAGVVIVRTHFPFGRAYQLAEEATHKAKDRRRAAPEESSWVDFHIALSGVTASLTGLRDSEYRSQDGKSLLWRPWLVHPEKRREKRQWSLFTSGVEQFQENWPRGRAKKLRDALAARFADAQGELAAARSRNCRPPSHPRWGEASSTGWDTETDNRETPFFDMIEAMDFWIPLEEKRMEGQA
jgi:CRISPR RNA silencing complex Cmr2 subunit-like protein